MTSAQIERLAELSEALEPFAKYGEVAKRLGTCDCVSSIRKRLGDGPEETLAEISRADCVKAHEVFSHGEPSQHTPHYILFLLGMGTAVCIMSIGELILGVLR